MSRAGHFVAIIGGAVAGAEAAGKLTQSGIRCVIFEQHALPYGKLETGLPKWHINLRNKQEFKINEKIRHPLVSYVPNCRLGQDIYIEDLIHNWGFSAILLATGAWRDRTLDVKGIDAYEKKGLYYQNPFVAWYNKSHDPAYNQQHFDIFDQTIVIGGGLASLDVMKILAIETTRHALEQYGHQIDSLSIERKGVYHILHELGLTPQKLGLQGCTLYYRRRLIDMPLNSLPESDNAEKINKALQVRKKIMDNFLNKYFFKFKECHQPWDMIIDSARLTGLVFKKTEIIDGNLMMIPDSEYEVKSPLIISAIGSLPQPIKGMPMEKDAFKIKDLASGQVEGFDNVFVLGNAVTGRGNIKESQMHGRLVSQKVMDEYLAWNEKDYQEIFTRATTNADEKIAVLQKKLKLKKVLNPEKIDHILSNIQRFQKKVNYNGDYDTWINNHIPIRLEDMIKFNVKK